MAHKTPVAILIVIGALAWGSWFAITSLLVRKEIQSLPQETMKIQSSAFENNGFLPAKYTCDGEDIHPPLQISGVPPDAQSLVLIVDDPDAPGGTWIHWTVWNIDPAIKLIPEETVPADAVQGITSFGKPGYGGPCPPTGMHRYFFKLFALNKLLVIPPHTGVDQLVRALSTTVIAQAELIGWYSRN